MKWRKNVTFKQYLLPFWLTEKCNQIIGENDGSFDNDDYILFYAEGLDTYNIESKLAINLYDGKSYYYHDFCRRRKELKKQTNPRQQYT
jgi:hypothetical protein